MPDALHNQHILCGGVSWASVPGSVKEGTESHLLPAHKTKDKHTEDLEMGKMGNDVPSDVSYMDL